MGSAVTKPVTSSTVTAVTPGTPVSAPKPAAAAWEVAADVPPEVASRRTVSILIWTVGFFIAIWLLGFSYSIPVSMILYLKFAGKEKWPMTIAVTFFTWLFIYGLFERALSIPFPEGLLFTLLQ